MRLESSQHIQSITCEYPWIVAKGTYTGCKMPNIIFIADKDAYNNRESTLYIHSDHIENNGIDCAVMQYPKAKIHIGELGYPRTIHVIVSDKIYEISCIPNTPSPKGPTCGCNKSKANLQYFSPRR